MERVVRTDGKFSGKEGLAEGAELMCEVLQKLFVPNAPTSIEIFRVIVFVHTEVGIETHLSREGIKAHRTILRIVKEGGVVSCALQKFRECSQSVSCVRRSDKWLPRTCDRPEECRHGIYRLCAASISIGHHKGVSQQRVYERSVGGVVGYLTI